MSTTLTTSVSPRLGAGDPDDLDVDLKRLPGRGLLKEFELATCAAALGALQAAQP